MSFPNQRSRSIVCRCDSQIWVSAIAPISSTNAIAMCVPAVVIAAGNVFDVPQNKCPGSFHPTLKVDGGEFLHKGLWQARRAA